MQPNMTQTARAVQSQGRGKDTMLVHMTPREVGGLQALAMAKGGSLSINPQTGLPEAGFLEDLLPTLIGVGLTFAGVDPATAGMIVGGGTTVATGDINQGLMAGLGAYGGASTATALNPSAAAPTAAPAVAPSVAAPSTLAPTTVAPAAPAAAPTLATGTTSTGLKTIAVPGSGDISLASSFTGPGSTAAQPTFMQRFSQAAAGPGGTPSMFKTGLAGIGTVAPFIKEPKYAPPEQEAEEPYEGPYTPTRRTVSYPTADERRRTSEFMYFSPSNPVPFAEGGGVSDANTPSMSAPEAQVFSQIANVQRLAGLPAIDASGFNVRSAIPSVEERMGLVYNPIDNTYSSPIGSSGTPLGLSGGAERNYGFQSLGNVAVPESGRAPSAAGGLQFFQPIGGFRQTALYGAPGLTTPASYLGSGFAREMDRSDPDEYRSNFEPVEMLDNSKPINMANYAYDPILGGYVKLPKFSYTSDDSGYYSYNYEKGGSVPELESGGFVLTKKAVDGLGKGDNKKGQKVASRGLGAIPIKGPGTGTSDSIKTTIDGKQPARIANGEAYVPKRQVAKRGGAKAFYALMNKAEKAADRRKRA